VRFVKICDQRFQHRFANVISLEPVVWSVVVTSNRENTVSSNSSEDGLIIFLEKSVHGWKLLLSQDVLESEMEMELKAFLGSSGKSFLLSVGVIRELDGFVDRWEVDEGREKTNPMEST